MYMRTSELSWHSDAIGRMTGATRASVLGSAKWSLCHKYCMAWTLMCLHASQQRQELPHRWKTVDYRAARSAFQPSKEVQNDVHLENCRSQAHCFSLQVGDLLRATMPIALENL